MPAIGEWETPGYDWGAGEIAPGGAQVAGVGGMAGGPGTAGAPQFGANQLFEAIMANVDAANQQAGRTPQSANIAATAGLPGMGMFGLPSPFTAPPAAPTTPPASPIMPPGYGSPTNVMQQIMQMILQQLLSRFFGGGTGFSPSTFTPGLTGSEMTGTLGAPADAPGALAGARPVVENIARTAPNPFIRPGPPAAGGPSWAGGLSRQQLLEQYGSAHAAMQALNPSAIARPGMQPMNPMTRSPLPDPRMLQGMQGRMQGMMGGMGPMHPAMWMRLMQQRPEMAGAF